MPGTLVNHQDSGGYYANISVAGPIREVLLLLDGQDDGLLPDVEDQQDDDEDPGDEGRVDQVIRVIAGNLLPEVEPLLRFCSILRRAEKTK